MIPLDFPGPFGYGDPVYPGRLSPFQSDERSVAILRVTDADSSMNEVVSERRGRILVVEDEEAISDLVCFHLDLAGYECIAMADGKEALRSASGASFDLLVLDITLPSLDGVTLCRAVRRTGPNRDVPIMMLTARRDEADKILGLESGADDYLTKPFGVREFLARATALMRRPRAVVPENPGRRVVSELGITIDPARRRVVCDDRPITLTAQEFNLLFLLVSNPGIVFTRRELFARVWHQDVVVNGRGIDALVKRLRRKVERVPAHPTRIVTVRGAGYKFGED
jgi:two-component system alkaline phosphatase synthesis response regulator PhoP